MSALSLKPFGHVSLYSPFSFYFSSVICIFVYIRRHSTYTRIYCACCLLFCRSQSTKRERHTLTHSYIVYKRGGLIDYEYEATVWIGLQMSCFGLYVLLLIFFLNFFFLLLHARLLWPLALCLRKGFRCIENVHHHYLVWWWINSVEYTEWTCVASAVLSFATTRRQDNNQHQRHRRRRYHHHHHHPHHIRIHMCNKYNVRGEMNV